MKKRTQNNDSTYLSQEPSQLVSRHYIAGSPRHQVETFAVAGKHWPCQCNCPDLLEFRSDNMEEAVVGGANGMVRLAAKRMGYPRSNGIILLPSSLI
jgi:hypothetical protein